MIHDRIVRDTNGNKLASFGPRRDARDMLTQRMCVEEAEPSTAGFWGVYRHDAEGLAHHVGDAIDEESAKAFAGCVAELEREQRRRVPVGMTFEAYRDRVGFPLTSTQEPMWRRCWEDAQAAKRQEPAE